MSFFDRVLDVAKSMGVKNFSYYKKWALDHLKKQLNEENQVTKAIEYCEDYLEKAYGVGTIRTWKGKKYIKGPDKKWRRYFEKNGRGTARAISNIMKEINSLENGDIEGLYAIIQKNAGRFRDENGNVLPEVQQIHDLVEKKQAGSETTKEEKPKLTATQRYEMGIRDEKYEQARKDAEMRNQNEKVEPMAADEVKKIHDKIEENRKKGKKVTPYEAKKQIENEELMNKVKQINDKAKEDIKIENQKKLIDLTKKHQDNLKKIAELSSKKNQEMNKRAEDFYKEHGKIAGKEDLGTSTYDKEIEDLLVEDAKVQKLGETISKNMEIKHPDIEETEQEKHDNRSNAMLGNDNAKKDGVSEEEVDPIKEMLDEFANDKKLKAAENKVNMETLSSDDCEGREILCGTYYEDGLEITTEGHVLAAIKSDYNEENENKIKANKEYIKFTEKKLKKLEDQKEKGFANVTRKLENDARIEKCKKILETKEIDGKFPNWRRVVPDQGDMTSVSDSFKNVDQIMKYCLVAEKMNPGKLNVAVKVGGKLYDPKYLFNALAMAKKNGMTHFEQEENRPLHVYNEKGDIVVMTLNYSDSYLDAESGKQNISSSTALPEDINNRVRGSVEDTPEVAEKNKEFEKYGYRIKKMKDGTWAAGYKKEDGSWLDGGLRVNAPTMEDVVRDVQSEINRKEESKKQEEKERAERERLAKERADVVEGYGTFFKGMDSKTKGRILKHLEKRVNFGNGKIQSYKEYIDDQFKIGDLEVKTHEEDKLKGPSRRAYNRMDGRQQEEYERRIKEAGKKTVYEIRSKAKGGYYDLGKYAYDYAKYLLENGGNVKKSFSERIADIMQKSGPEEPKHDLEYFKKWALSVLDKQKEEPGEEDGPSEETIVKALAYTEMIAKAGYPVGTIREWKGKKYIKVAPNQWKPKYDKINRGAKMSLTHLKKAVANCNSEEELYNLMNTNASRFRDENGHPLPEVQELHDIVSKRQAEMSNTGDSGENAGESAGNGGSAEVNGSEEKKEDKKTSYADKIAAIQKMGKKTENAIETTGSSGRADKVAENAVDDTVTAVKNAVSKNENKAKKDKKQVEMNGIPDVEMTDEEKENFLKQFEEEPENDVESEGMENVSKEDKIKAVAEKLAEDNESVEDWKEQLSQMPDSFIEEKFGEISGGNANNSGNSGSTKDEEGLSNQAEDEQDKRIGGSALWDQHVRNAIKTGDVDKIKTAIAQVENEYNELSKKAKYQDEKEFLMYELKYRKRDAENAINKLQKK